MPILPSTPTGETRRPLRDVAFNKLLAAIVNGRLNPGQRLDDEELVKWLWVPRAHVREAIAQLHTYGLVELDGGRHPRVAARDDVAHSEAAQFLAGLHSLAREWGAHNLDVAPRENMAKSLQAARKQLVAHDLAGPGSLLDIQGELTKASGNTLLADAEEPLRLRVNYLRPHDADAYDWDDLIATADQLAAAINR